ncbi:hypothetical protein HGB47_16395 [Leptospira yasudae]|uniref:hypothetical protein n=1 Tax=Leptospira yasudae TaxID=2202201 RepID=UPI001C4E8E12|nr:hypothetical protein [Leptospira yasudae]MBW0435193.1 hypothetical protein [Leptospira yasudae]
MSNNVKLLMGQLFTHLSQGIHDPKECYIKATHHDSEEWLKYSKLNKISPIYEFYPLIIGILEFKTVRYFYIANSEFVNFKSNIYEEIIENSGPISFIISNVKPPIKVNSESYIENYIFYPKSKEYNGHDISVITECFNKIYLFRVDDAIDVYKVFSQLLLESNLKSGILESQVSQSYIEGLLALNLEFPYIHLSHAIWSSSHEKTFIELYRIIECIFPIPDLGRLIGKIGNVVNLKDLYESFENFKNWNILNRSSFESLAKELPLTVSQEICTKIENITNENAFDFLYRLRNLLVHSSLYPKRLEYSNHEWKMIFESLLIFINSTYSNHSDILLKS